MVELYGLAFSFSSHLFSPNSSNVMKVYSRTCVYKLSASESCNKIKSYLRYVSRLIKNYILDIEKVIN